MKKSLVFACLLALLVNDLNCLPMEDAFAESLQKALHDFVEMKGQLVYSENEYSQPTFKWKDCGGSAAKVHIKGFQMDPVCPKSSGKAMIGFNVTADSDVTSPINLVMTVRKKVLGSWVNVCSHVPGGCKRSNACPFPKGLAFAKGEGQGERQGEGVGELGDSSQSMCIAKGDFVYPMKSYDVKAPPGEYRVTANFKTVDATRVACLDLQFQIC